MSRQNGRGMLSKDFTDRKINVNPGRTGVMSEFLSRADCSLLKERAYATQLDTGHESLQLGSHAGGKHFHGKGYMSERF